MQTGRTTSTRRRGRTKQTVVIALVAIAAILATIGTSVSDADANGDTSVETVASAAVTNREVHLTLDSSGTPSVGYSQSGVRKIARCRDLACSSRSIQRTTVSSTSESVTLADDDSNPVLSASWSTDRTNKTLSVTTCTNANCTATTTNGIDMENATETVALAIDSEGLPVIAHAADSNGRHINLIRCATADCSAVESIQFVRTSGRFVQLVLDSSDRAVIAYRHAENRSVNLVRCQNQNCSTRSFAQLAADSIWPPTLALGTDDRPVVAFDNVVAICNDSRCDSTTISAVEFPSGHAADLVLDDNNVPVVALVGNSNRGGVAVGRCVDASCTGSTINQVSQLSGATAALALDADSNPVVAYLDGSAGLLLARCSNPECDSANLNFDVPTTGRYLIQSLDTGRYLDADPNGDVGTSRVPAADDEWLVGPHPQGFSSRIENAIHDAPLLFNARWVFEPVGDGAVYVRRLGDDGRPDYLSTSGNEVLRDQRAVTDRWIFVPIEEPPIATLVGQRIALQNATSSRWLDADRDGSVNQSAAQRADDVWLVEDGGDGALYLRNEVTGRYLDGDRNGSVDTSGQPRNDDRWTIVESDGVAVLENAAFGGFLEGGGFADSFEVALSPATNPSTSWQIRILQPAG